MMLHRHLKCFAAAAFRFARANGGNVAPIFALTSLPILASIGAAVDYSRAVRARTELQAAVDSTALMLSQDAASLTNAQLNTKAQSYFNALYTTNEVSGVTVTAAYTPNNGSGSTVTVTSQGNMQSDFMQVVGYPTMSLNVTGTSTWGNTKLRIAMALDNTGSMAQNNKMAALQGGANSLIDQLSAGAASNGDVYISIVPFANEVNMGTSFKNSGYIDWTNWSTNGSNEENYSCGSYNQSPSWQNNWQGTMRCGTSYNSTSNWNGCVMDRGPQNLASSTTAADDQTKTVPGSGTTLFPADQSSYCPQPVIPLSYNWSQLKQTVNNMSPNGSTNQAIGLHHAWLTLQQTAPYNAPAENSNYNYVKAIILLSDGLNTQDRWYGDGSSASTQVDDRQAGAAPALSGGLCQAIKNSGIVIYSIQVNTAGDPQSAVLAACATDPAHFFYLTSSTQILSTFNSIGTQLSKLRISH